MGTNFYFFSKNKELMSKHFPTMTFKSGRRDEGCSLVDEPEFGYEAHICKMSCGWLPLFEHHREAFTSFDELEKFYQTHKEDLRVFDEYGEEFTWETFKDIALSHGARGKTPVKWVYEEMPKIGIFSQNSGKVLRARECKGRERADLHSPFRHDEYFRTEIEARKKYCLNNGYIPYDSEILRDYYRDPNEKYEIDWAYGSFS